MTLSSAPLVSGLLPLNPLFHCSLSFQWSFGVTCWEVFTCGAMPYDGVPPVKCWMETDWSDPETSSALTKCEIQKFSKNKRCILELKQ